MAIAFATASRAGFAAAMFALLIVAAVRAEDAPQPSAGQLTATPSGRKSGTPGGRAETPASPSVAEQHKLPADSITKHTLALPGRSLAFTATAGSIRLFDTKGEAQGDLAYPSYQLHGADPRRPPGTFLGNGGAGAASAWLQFGDAGPWRLSFS